MKDRGVLVSSEPMQSKNPVEPCTWQPSSQCEGCPLAPDLMCRFDARDLFGFLLNFAPYGIATIGGMVRAGYGWYLLVWLAYWVFFFFVWEARVLCSHCPYWAERGPVLHCHANYGVVKICKYRPGPMGRAERIQFIVGALLFVGFPFVFLLLGRQYLLALVALAAAVNAGFNLRRNVCRRCIHFSCPMNAVPKRIADAYLTRNPGILRAWEARGYRLGE